MALELSVYCGRAKLPTVEQWSAAIKKDGFDLTFIDGLNWKKPNGAVKLNGDETHFELNLFPNHADDDPPQTRGEVRLASGVPLRLQRRRGGVARCGGPVAADEGLPVRPRHGRAAEGRRRGRRSAADARAGAAAIEEEVQVDLG